MCFNPPTWQMSASKKSLLAVHWNKTTERAFGLGVGKENTKSIESDEG